MSMRISSALLVTVSLAACGTADPAANNEALLESEAQTRSELAESGRVYCAVNGGEGFRPECQIERTQGSEGLVLTMRHPDGGFRRLLVTNDGRGLIAADGSEPAIVTPVSEREVEVSIGFDRYRLPATVR
ncbi:hypothetical protein [Parasphingopyxis marina]|uniref:Lipoprotein n=1 Tax=Parasphingopyxis marina TaxID=2761622 RepID=A0A842HXN9_9SPHN|nr:hypothetical protein [Parasphingopyxis marina]MBC2777645.1 hypothetical protein [Parasphingopyxis marina]